MSKTFKFKSDGKNNNDLTSITSISSLSDLKGKLFLYYKLLFNQLKTDCPAKGSACEINKTHRAFFLANIPYNLNFSLINSKKYGKILTHLEILKTFILIPKILDLSVLFDYSSKQKVFYEFLGGFLLKPNKSYSCFFRQVNPDESTYWIHYDCGKIISKDQSANQSFTSWFDLISYCLGAGEYPFMLFYQIQQKYSENEKDITVDEINTLERHARNADNFSSIVMYKFRPTEDIINSEPSSISNSVHMNNQENINNLNKNQSKNSSSISTSRNTSNNNSNSRIDLGGEYNCIYCFAKNRMDCILCYKCNQNNESVIEDILKKKHLNNNYINIANFNLNINTEEKGSFKTKENLIEKNKNEFNTINHRESNNEQDNKYEQKTDREIKNFSINKKHMDSIQPQSQQRIPFEIVKNKKEINLINNDEDMKIKSINFCLIFFL